jgi:hypothetical protein
VLRKGKREKKWLSLDPLVARLLRAWLAKRSKKPGPLFLRVGKGDRILSGKRLSWDGIHKILGTMGDKLGGVIRMGSGMRQSRQRWKRPTAMSVLPENSPGTPRSRGQ